MEIHHDRLQRTSFLDEIIGEIGPALRHAEEAVLQARVGRDPETICEALARQASLTARLGQYENARQLALEALSHSASSAYSVNAMLTLGQYQMITEDLVAAEEYSQQAADLSLRLGDTVRLARSLHQLSVVALARGKFSLALATAADAVRIDPTYPRWIEPMVRAVVYHWMGERRLLHTALADMRQTARHGTTVEAAWYCFAAWLALDEEDAGEALRLLEQGRPLAERVGDARVKIWLYCTMGRWHRLYGELAAALEWTEKALALARRAGNHYEEGWALTEHAQVEWDAGQLAAAERSLLAARALHQAIGADYYLAQETFLLAALYQQQQQSEAEAFWLEAAARIEQGGYLFILERERKLAFPLLVAYGSSGNPSVAAVTEQLLSRLQRVEPPPLHIQGLGAFSVYQGRHRISDRAWQRRKAGELFRYLLLQPGLRALREVVIDVLWPDRGDESAQSLFHQATSTLRRLLEPDLPGNFPSRYLTVEAEQISLRLPEGSTCDFVGFEAEVAAALAQADGEALAAALAHYAGDLFPGDRYAEWPVARRERLRQVYLDGLLALARMEVAAGHYHRALAHLRQILEQDPWAEDAVLLGMTAYRALHNRPAALRLYQQLQLTLQQELGLQPRDDLRAFAASLRA
jgi:DNA-binding SARP family transcriptional activator